MSPADQARYFPDQSQKLTPANSKTPPTPRLERDQHAIFQNWLLSHNFAFRHSRTDKATRETTGAPDFTVYEKPLPSEDKARFPTARALAIEFKLPGNKLSPPQDLWAFLYGAQLHIVPTALDAINLVSKYFGS